MKKTLLIWIFICSGVYMSGQNLKPSSIPGNVKATFTDIYPNSQPSVWSKYNGNFSAQFELNNKNMYMVINPAGEWVETRAQITRNDLPAATLTYLTANYGAENLKEMYKVTHAGGGVITYQVETGDQLLQFSTDGTFLKTEKASTALFSK
jgi:hypothetical protein